MAAATQPDKIGVALHCAHDCPLPPHYKNTIPDQDVQILRFLKMFLAESGLSSVPLFINGGYVRDLLLGKTPDDLDLTVCLRGCPEKLTVADLMNQLPDFSERHPELGIKEVKIATILGNEAKEKTLDTFKAHFTNLDDVKTEVDIMPSIGEERYEGEHRIPVRDQRGTAEQDALRRDLTIGAMLLLAEVEGDQLSYRLLDYYGGIDDLRNGVLRSPFPTDKALTELRDILERSSTDALKLIRLFGLDELHGKTKLHEQAQVLWWAKILLDDPLRICRALRFQAKLRDFRLHASFWQAAPFALDKLRSKVAGSRKDTEYQKIGGYGFRACLEFFELAFTNRLGSVKSHEKKEETKDEKEETSGELDPKFDQIKYMSMKTTDEMEKKKEETSGGPDPGFDPTKSILMKKDMEKNEKEETGDKLDADLDPTSSSLLKHIDRKAKTIDLDGDAHSPFASSLFGGKDDKGKSKHFANVTAFALEDFKVIVAPFDSVKDAPELMGGLLAAAAACSTFEASDTNAEQEFSNACKGMCVSNAMREAGERCFQAVASLSATTPAAGILEELFAAACDMDLHIFALHVQVWEALRALRSDRQQQLPQLHRCHLVLKLLGRRDEKRMDEVRQCMDRLCAVERQDVRGRMMELPELLVPPQLRGKVMNRLDVCLRILGETTPLEDSAHLANLSATQPRLLEALSRSNWYKEDGRTLRDEFAPPKKVAKK